MAKNAKKKATKPATKTAKAMPKRVASKPAAKAAKPKTAKAPASSGGFAFTRIAPGFTVKERWEIEGKFMGAEMNSGSVTVNLGQDDWKLGRDRNKGQGTRMYITTGPDIDGLAEQLKARGASLDSDPKDEWGVRAFSLTDPDGYKLTFMTPLKK
jgi:uncharacterized glyoxalase superfamily protein PhnB